MHSYAVCACSRELGTEKGSRALGEPARCEECRKGSVCIYEVGNSVGIYLKNFFFFFIKEIRGLVV